MRGEYIAQAIKTPIFAELPPHARRIRALNHSNFLCHGTTSACAENTAVCGGGDGRLGNYLRVRGEYRNILNSMPSVAELPPRTRRIPDQAFDRGGCLGTTSAHAENTTIWRSPAAAWNYLRARGEYREDGTDEWFLVELPPRTRRIRKNPCIFNKNQGTTSAHAENT